jgi:hypothetical protein
LASHVFAWRQNGRLAWIICDFYGVVMKGILAIGTRAVSGVLRKRYMHFVMAALCVFGIALSGCATAQGVLNSIASGLSSITDNTGGERSASSASPIPGRYSKNYSLPASYETAYAYRTDKPDPQMAKIPQNIEAYRTANPDEYIRQIAAYINANSTNDFERVKKAHDLVAVMVHYDAANFWSNTVPDQSYRNVLKTRLAVCEGYSNLLKKLCDALKIPCDIVHGFGRGVGTSPLSGDTPNNSNHAWNIVTINEESYLVDCTWNSGYMDGKVSKQQYTTDWLFLKAEHFIYTHYPENEKQQLLAAPLTAAQFSALPFFKPKFFELANDISVDLKKINKVENKLSFDYSIKDGYWLNFSVHDIKTGKNIQNRDFVQTNGTKGTAYFSFPAAGQYSVNVFWWKTGAKQGAGCGEFVVESASSSPVQYPVTYSSSAKNLQIISPIEMPLERGKTYNFRIKVDNKKVVAIIHDRTFVQMTKDAEGIFSINFEIPVHIKSLSVGIADSEKGRYETIAQYQVK